MTKLKLSTLVLSVALSGNLAFGSGDKLSFPGSSSVGGGSTGDVQARTFDECLADAGEDNYTLVSVYMSIANRIPFSINQAMVIVTQSAITSENMPEEILSQAVDAVVHRSFITVEESLNPWRDQYPETVGMIRGLYEALLPHNGPADKMEPSAYGALKAFFAEKREKTFEDCLRETKDGNQHGIASVYLSIVFDEAEIMSALKGANFYQYIQTYLASGKNVNELVDGKTWLSWAIHAGNNVLFDWLLTMEANADTQDADGLFPIHQILKNKQGAYGAMIDALQARGFDLNVKTQNERAETALHIIARDADLIYDTFYILQPHVNLDAVDAEGYTALDRLNGNGWENVALFLLDKGARLDSDKADGAINTKIRPFIEERARRNAAVDNSSASDASVSQSVDEEENK